MFDIHLLPNYLSLDTAVGESSYYPMLWVIISHIVGDLQVPRPILIPNKGGNMRIAVTLFLLACTQVSADTKLVFSSLELDQTNRGSININGYDRHFSITFPTAYDNSVAYPVVLFFHGCMCRPSFTDEAIKSYLDWAPRLEAYKDDFITIKMSAFSEKKPEVPQEVSEGGARGMWFWHKGLEAERDDYAFVDTLITELLSSSDINIDPQNIFGDRKSVV